MAALGAALAFLILFGLDRFVDTTVAGRVALFVVGIIGALVLVPWAMGKWVVGHRSLDSIANRIKRRDPLMGDRVLSVLELTQNEQEFQRSPELVAAAIEQGAAGTKVEELRASLPVSRHVRFGVLAAGALAVCALGFVLYPSAAKNTLARLVRPGGEIERYTFAQVEAYPKEQVVARMEPFQVLIALDRETRRSPESATLSIAGMGEVTAQRLENAFSFDMPGLSEPVQARLKVGDYRGQIEVQPMDRPELVAATAQIRLPEYLEIETPIERDVRSGSVSVVEDSRVAFHGQATRELAQASWDLGPIEVEGDLLRSAAVVASDKIEAQIEWLDAVGLEGILPFQFTVRARPDGRPTVSMKGLGQEAILLHDKVLSLEIQAEDDFGVRQVGIEWESVGEVRGPFVAASGSKLLQTGAPDERRIELSAAFHPKSLGIDPQALQVRAFAQDALPGRPRVYSAPVIVQIMTEEEHMIWVTGELSKWFDKAVEVRDTEHQLLQTNEEFHAMENSELASAPVQRDLLNQADKERANARRLNRLLESGSELLQEALRNEQFNSNTLDDWAEMMAVLAEVGEKKMPSVAELLSKAARAESSVASAAGPSEPSQGSPAEQPAESPPGASPGERPKGQENPKGKPQAAAGGPAGPKPKLPNAPSVDDPESHFNDPAEAGKPGEKPSAAPPSNLTLASTSVAGGGAKPEDQDEPGTADETEEPPGPTKAELAKALAEQRALMAEFEKVTGKIQEILRNLEGSTFVKRLKSLSRSETRMAKELDGAVSVSFGSDEVPESARETFEATSTDQRLASEKASVVRADLGAYVERLKSKGDKIGHFDRVYTEMGERGVAQEITTLGALASMGMVGETIAGSENLADDLDRWAELLIGPG